MTETKAALAYPRLCIAYLCQFAIWGAWAGALGQYAGKHLAFTGGQIGWLYNAIPLGAVIAPLLIGPIADRYFSAQKVMSVLHLVGGLALLACGWLCMTGEQSFPVLMGLMLLSGACYMPTMGLINSVVFKHLPSAGMAPYVFVFGTIGWIIVNLIIAAFCGGADTPYFFLVGGGFSLFLAFYALTLPDTPPKGAPAPGEKKSGGLGVLVLFKDFPFVIFVLCAFLASIPACNYFFPAQVSFLTERGYPSPVALTTINQFSEILFMVALPFCIPRFGLKNVLLIGMAAWSLRYFCFAEPYFAMAVLGLLLHGLCYTFLYVAAYMYAEKVAPAHLKASAQSMMVFLLLGVGQVLGGLGYGYMRDSNQPQFAGIKTELRIAEGSEWPEGIDPTDTVVLPFPVWSESEDSMFQYLDLAAQVDKLLGRKDSKTRAIEFFEQARDALNLVKEKTRNEEVLQQVDEHLAAVESMVKSLEERKIDFGKLLQGKPLTAEAIDSWNKEDLIIDNVSVLKVSDCCDDDSDHIGVSPQFVKALQEKLEASKAVIPVVSVQYTKDDLKRLATEIGGENFSLTRSDKLAALAHDWAKIFRLPAILIAVCFVVFLLLGRNPKEEAAEAQA